MYSVEEERWTVMGRPRTVFRNVDGVKDWGGGGGCGEFGFFGGGLGSIFIKMILFTVYV